MFYNTLYDVSIIQLGIYEQPNQTVFIELSYSKLKYLLIGGWYAHLSHMTCYVGKCDDPSKLIIGMSGQKIHFIISIITLRQCVE